MPQQGRFRELVSPTVLGIEPYKPGKPIEELQREKSLSRIIKLASNENPLGAPEAAAEAVARLAREGKLHLYPDGFGFALKTALAKRWGVGLERIALGNGSSEIIEMTVRLFARPGTKTLLASPSFSIYEIAVTAQGAVPVNVPLKDHTVDLDAIAAAVDERTTLVILGNPNNPTGTIFRRAAWEKFYHNLPPHVVVLLDEAYAEYAEDPDFPEGAAFLDEGRPLVVARTFSKAYGIAALRLGYALAPAEIVDYMNRLRLPFNANAAAQAAGLAALADGAHLARSLALNREGRERLCRFFSSRGMDVVPSQANFVLAKVGDGDLFFKNLLDRGVIVRSAAGFGMPEWVRITVGLPEELDFFEEQAGPVLSQMGKGR